MTNARAVLGALLLMSPLMAGCAAMHGGAPPPPPPPPDHRPIAAKPPKWSCAPGTPCAPKGASPYRQYYDVRHRRYYYFDPSKGAYFWEDGQPRR